MCFPHVCSNWVELYLRLFPIMSLVQFFSLHVVRLPSYLSNLFDSFLNITRNRLLVHRNKCRSPRLLLHSKEWWDVSRNLDKSADEVVDIQVTSQLSSAQRQSVVDHCHYQPTTTRKIACYNHCISYVVTPPPDRLVMFSLLQVKPKRFQLWGRVCLLWPTL